MRIETLKEKLYECSLHQKRLLIAREYLQSIIPLDVRKYENLEEIQMSFVDQMVYRFSKLKDTMGEKIFPSILLLDGEDVKKMTFIDRFIRLEELGIVEKEEWMRLRKYRNEIAHEYSFNVAQIVEGINRIYQESEKLLHIFNIVKNYVEKTYGFTYGC